MKTYLTHHDNKTVTQSAKKKKKKERKKERKKRYKRQESKDRQNFVTFKQRG